MKELRGCFEDRSSLPLFLYQIQGGVLNNSSRTVKLKASMTDWIQQLERRYGQAIRRFFVARYAELTHFYNHMSRKNRSRLEEDMGFIEKPSRSQRVIEMQDYREPIRPNRRPLVAQNDNQQRYLTAMKTSTVTIGAGPAGVGKTYIVGSYAAECLLNGEFKSVLFTRPNVETGPSLGFLPGTLEEKYEPFIKPFRAVMVERLGKSDFEGKLKSGAIMAEPLTHMRGETYKDCLMILDEAQNCSIEQMKMFLTRIGEGSRIVINGDVEQSDLREVGGLEDLLYRCRGEEDFTTVQFTENDCVRHGIIKTILRMYRKR